MTNLFSLPRSSAQSGLLARVALRAPVCVCLMVCLTSLGCADLVAPTTKSKAQAAAEPAAEGAERRAPNDAPPDPAQPDPASPPQERARASHILIAYANAMRANPETKRNKAEAEKLARDLLGRIKGGGDFAELAKKHSDDPGSARAGGDLGRFTQDSMVEAFSKATFALKPGELSGIVETPFGYHVIKRTE